MFPRKAPWFTTLVNKIDGKTAWSGNEDLDIDTKTDKSIETVMLSRSILFSFVRRQKKMMKKKTTRREAFQVHFIKRLQKCFDPQTLQTLVDIEYELSNWEFYFFFSSTMMSLNSEIAWAKKTIFDKYKQ